MLPENEDFNLKLQMKCAKFAATNNTAKDFGCYHYHKNIHFADSKGIRSVN